MFIQTIIRANRQLFTKSSCCCCSSTSAVSSILNRKLHTSLTIKNHPNEHGKSSTGTTASLDEVEKFRNLANSWWNEKGEFKALHSMNPIRINMITTGLLNTCRLKSIVYPEPLKGLNLLDIGCGGGILSEPLARLGGNVVGIDATEEGIQVAKAHAELQKLKINYVCSTVEQYVEDNPQLRSSFDVIVMSEVIEHVLNPPIFISAAAKLLKPQGSLFITTINRTWQSYMSAIIAAEHLLQLVPRGTHQWKKFLEPEEIAIMLENNGLEIRFVDGLYYYPQNNTWQWAGSTKVNYAVHAINRNES